MTLKYILGAGQGKLKYFVLSSNLLDYETFKLLK